LRAPAQTPTPSPSPPPVEDVLRINAELVQTDVMVFDKSGSSSAVSASTNSSCLSMVSCNPSLLLNKSEREFKEVRLLSTAKDSAAAVSANSPINENRGRTIVFFIDDLHLSPDSLSRTRKTLAHFIDNEMNENDRVAIASTSGDIGFLQQFTDYNLFCEPRPDVSHIMLTTCAT